MRLTLLVRSSLLLLALIAVGSCRRYATRPDDRLPVISSITAFPSTIRITDSTMVTVIANDPDGDALGFDWDGLELQALTRGQTTALASGAYLHTQVLHPTATAQAGDTAWVWFLVLDGRGGFDERSVRVALVP